MREGGRGYAVDVKLAVKESVSNLNVTKKQSSKVNVGCMTYCAP